MSKFSVHDVIFEGGDWTTLDRRHADYRQAPRAPADDKNGTEQHAQVRREAPPSSGPYCCLAQGSQGRTNARIIMPWGDDLRLKCPLPSARRAKNCVF